MIIDKSDLCLIDADDENWLFNTKNKPIIEDKNMII